MPASTVNKVRVRTYRHGLGDCHLVSFARVPKARLDKPGDFFHLLIDCGVVKRTTNPGPLMSGVMQDVSTQTAGVLDLVVATHAHTDHLSGFKQAAPVFDPMTVKRLWLGWLEEPGNKAAKKIQDELVKKLAAVRAATARLAAVRSSAATRIQGLLDYFGPVAAAGDQMEDIIGILREKSKATPEYQHPGTTFLLPELPNVRVYVLGPPKNVAEIKVMDPRKSKHEGYEEQLAASTDGFAAALSPGADDAETESSHPFDKRLRIPEDRARKQPFFKKHYFSRDSETKKSQEWRRIDNAWLEAAEKLALYLDDYTNNSSLALAFEFLDTKEVLLFPGDAQIGSWLTWHQFKSFKQPGGAEHKTGIRDLFERVVFYKASHHASHNGTLSGLGEEQTGLEQMKSRDLVCVVPVDRAMSKEMNWDRTLPWKPLLDRLAEKTRGRLVLTDINEPPPKPAKLKLLSAPERKQFARQVKITPEWLEYTL